jgi:hypothetical protein
LAGFLQRNFILRNGTAFRFYNSEDNKKSVVSTTTISLFWTSIAFLGIALINRKTLSDWSNIDVQYVTYTIWITLDALVIVPFQSFVRKKRPMSYAIIK